MITDNKKAILAGAVAGLLAWWMYSASRAKAANTLDDEAGGWGAGADGFLDVAYSAAGAIMPGNMEISYAGLNHIKQFEGYSATVYNDVAGYPTIGYGHKITLAERTAGLKTVTEQEATRLLAADVATAEAAVNRLVKVALNQGQFDALVSFVYNVGAGAFSRSTMLKLLNAGDYTAAAGQFSRWVYAGGQQSSGLFNRRQGEIALFNNTRALS